MPKTCQDYTLLNKAIELLKRWDKISIPSEVFTEPGEDYLIPLDTQAFLKKVNNIKRGLL